MRCFVLSRYTLDKILESSGNARLIYYLNYYGGQVTYESYEEARKLFKFKTRGGAFKRIKKLIKQNILKEYLDFVDGRKFYTLLMTGLTDVE